MRRLPTWLLFLPLAACGEGAPPHAYLSPQTETQAATVCAAGTTLQGADLSSYQGAVDWASVAATGLTFSIAKATEGNDIDDSEFAANWAGMKANGVIRGAYHFFRPNEGNGAGQADFFLGQVADAGGFGPGDLPPFLDWESSCDYAGNNCVTAATDITVAQDFIAEIQAKTGLTTIIYTGYDYWLGLGTGNTFASYPLWMAYPQGTCPEIPAPWSQWLIWQYSWTGTINGMNCPGACDMDEFNGDLSQLQAIGVGGDGGVIAPPDGGTTLPATVLPQLSGNDAVTLVNWPDEHVSVFAKSPSGTVVHSDTAGTGDAWSAPTQLDTGAACGSAASFWGGSWLYPELFSPLTAGGTGHLWWTSANGWTTYQSYGGTGLSHLSTLVWPNGQTEVFALGSDGAAWHQYWDVGTSAWSGWLSMGGTGFTQGPTGIVWADGHGELYEVDGAGNVWRSQSSSGLGTGWGAFAQLGSGLASRVAPVRWPDGTVELFGRGTDGTLWRDTAQSPGTTFAGFSQLVAQGIAGDPSAFVNPGDGAEVVARDPSGNLVDLAYSVGSASWPANFTALGQTSASDPFGWIRGDGQAELFAIDASGDLLHALRPTGGSFGAFASIGSGLDPCAAALPPVDGGIPDAGSVADAGRTPDAGPKVDAGAQPDAGPGLDAGSPLDAGEGDAGAIQGPAPEGKAGCGCNATGGGDPAWLLAGLAALLAKRRRR
ncbi:MAG TPA: GH25 family lysozyme [Myxococcales bacterium]|nr:GH25 family lysozyme [Myxococcales bacterium]